MPNTPIPKFNWGVYFLIILTIRLLFLDISWHSFIAVAIMIHQFMSFFMLVGYVVPIRYIFGIFISLQFLLGPTFAYNGLDPYQYFMYRMRIPEEEYFTYAIPAVVAFIFGLHVFSGKLKGELLDTHGIRQFVDQKPMLIYWLIGIGFSSSILGSFFSSELAFVFYLLGGLKFVGVFMLIFSTKKLQWSAIVLVMGSILFSSLGEGMFHDLLTWLIMLAAVYAIKIKPSLLFKSVAFFSFLTIAIIIQLTKGDYRAKLAQGAAGDIDTFEEAYKASNKNKGVFSFERLAENNTRINQGFILTNVMYRIPRMMPYSDGQEMMQIVQSAVFPRVIYKDKLKAGDRKLFTRYSGINLTSSTSMGLGSLSDGYINYGLLGGIFFMFCLGALYAVGLNRFYAYSKNYPALLLFAPLVYYYPIRPDCELQTALGHYIKALFLIWVIHVIWKNTFYKKQTTT